VWSFFKTVVVPVTNNANIYGLIGVAKTKTDGSMPNVDSTALSVMVVEWRLIFQRIFQQKGKI